MAANRRMSRVLDEHRFDTLAASIVPEPSTVGVTDVFIPKLWTCNSTSVDDGGEQIGAVLRVAEIT
jgi:hypothetical protein